MRQEVSAGPLKTHVGMQKPRITNTADKTDSRPKDPVKTPYYTSRDLATVINYSAGNKDMHNVNNSVTGGEGAHDNT